MSSARICWKTAVLTAALMAGFAGEAGAQLKKGKLRKTERQDCLDCHQKEAKDYGARDSIHPAVKAGDCQACHLRHGVVGVLRLAAQDPELCLACHPMEGEPRSGRGATNKGAVSGVSARSHLFTHPPPDAQKCGGCHDPHASERPMLLRAAGSESCLGCHDEAGFQGESRHSPDLVGCLECHDPHGSAREASLARAPSDLCSPCHEGGSPGERRGHGGSAPAGDSCLGCHAPHASAKGGLLRANVHPPMAQGPGSCETCHTASDGAAESFPVNAPALELCLSCHEDPREATRAAGLAADRVHSPVAEGDCQQCHTPHASDQEGLLRGAQSSVCGTCHTEAADATGTKAPHRPAAEACTSCHLPHAGPARLLLAETPALCESCHGEVKEQTSRKVPHPPAAEGNCLTCHDPHGTDHEGLLVTDAGSLCLGCHEPVRTQLGARVAHEPAASGRCVSCHEPHGSVDEHLTVANLGGACLSCHQNVAAQGAENPHAPVTEGDCLSCHSPHASGRESLLTKDVGVLCRSCHQDLPGESTALVRHLPVQRGQCLSCHAPHGGHSSSMLRMAESKLLCLSCHVEEGKLMSRQDHSVHPPFRDESCLECHTAHASAEHALLATAPEKLCATCHDATDPTLAAPHRGLLRETTDCTSCHDAHASPHEGLLLADRHQPFGDGDCAACHRGTAP